MDIERRVGQRGRMVMERMVVAEGKGCCGGREEGGAEEDGEAVKKKRMKGKLRMEKGGEAKGECYLSKREERV